MNEFRLIWEPESLADSATVSRQVMKYMDNQETFAQFPNGSCLILKPVADLDETVAGAMREARRIPDFKVYEMEDHDYLVSFANPLMVYVGKDEFETRKSEIETRIGDLHFPSEKLIFIEGQKNPTHVLVGLYARGKLQKDAWQSAYSITRPN